MLAGEEDALSSFKQIISKPGGVPIKNNWFLPLTCRLIRFISDFSEIRDTL